MTEALNDKKRIISVLLLSTAFAAYWCFANPRFMVISFTLIALLLLFVLILFSAGILNIKRDKLFLGALIILGLFFCFVIPPMSVPDEPFHYVSTYWIVDGITGKGSLLSSDAIMMRNDDWLLYSNWSSTTISSSSYLNIANHFSLFCTDASDHVLKGRNFSLSGVYISARIFTVLGFMAGKLLNLGPFPTFYLGRLASLAFYIFAAYSAFKIAPKGKSAIAFVSLLPMSLHVAASYSYDSGILAYAFLIFGFLMKGFYGEDGSIDLKQVVLYCIIAAFLAPCKVIYCVLAFVALLIPQKKFVDKRLAIASKAAVLFVSVASIGVLRLSALTSMSTGTELSHRGEETGHFFTLSGVIGHPINSFKIIGATLDSLGDFHLMTMFGYSLGWFQGNLQMPYFFMLPYLGLGALCCFKSEDEDALLSKKPATAFVLGFIFVAAGAYASMWLGWTFDTETVISGVQGRYFLPALPFLLYGLRSNRFVFSGKTANLEFYGMSAMNLLYLIRFVSVATLS